MMGERFVVVWGELTHFVVDGKVADLHGDGNEVDSTVELILFKLFLQIHILFVTVGDERERE